MIDLPPEQLRQVRDILARVAPDLEAWAYGSRVKGRARPYSDLDLVVVGGEPLPLDRLIGLRSAFEESDLPIRVDVADWNALSPSFRALIEAERERLAPG